jgi:hypothetical protein
MASSSKLAAQASQILNDPKQLEQITERVYELIQENLRQQQEKFQSYGSDRGWS